MPKTAAKEWHPEDIKAELRKRRWTMTGVARSYGLAEATVRCSFRRPIPAANRAVARVIGVPLHELWPYWFDAEGNRLPSNYVDKDNAPAPSGHRQKRVAK